MLPAGVHLRSTAPEDALVQELEAGIGAALDELGVARTGPDEADVVLFVEPLANKFRAYADALLADPVLRESPERCFVFEQSDRPVPYLPGLYVSLPVRRHEPARTRAVASWGAADDGVARALIAEVDASLLCSFRGYPNAAVRIGGTRCRRNSPAGARRSSPPRAFAPFLAPSFVAALMSLPARCSCRASSISAPVSAKER